MNGELILRFTGIGQEMYLEMLLTKVLSQP